MAAWPRCAHIARRRKRAVAWSNGGTELSLGRESAIIEEKCEALLVLESRAFGQGHRQRRLVITAAMPVPLAWLVRAELGRERLAGVVFKRGAVLAKIERVYAGRVLSVREETPQGDLAAEAIRDLILRGRIFRGTTATLESRHSAGSLAAQLDGAEAWLPLPEWLLARLKALGLAEVADLEMLDGEDILPPALPEHIADKLRRQFPTELSIGDARYSITYEPVRREATLEKTAGLRKTPPPPKTLPRLPGWRILLKHKQRTRILRDR